MLLSGLTVGPEFEVDVGERVFEDLCLDFPLFSVVDTKPEKQNFVHFFLSFSFSSFFYFSFLSSFLTFSSLI